MKKKLTTTLGLTTVAATGLFAQSVYAEETVTPAVAEANVATETTVKTTTTPVAPVTDAQVLEAETAKNTAEEAVADAEATLADIQATIDTTAAELSQAQAVAEKVENIQPVIDQAESDKAQAEEAKAISEAEQATATAAVTDAQADVTTATETVTNAQADETRQQAIDTAQTSVTETKATLDTATTDLNTATSANQTAQADLTAKAESFTTAENDYKSIQKFVVIPEYVEALDKYKNSRGEEKLMHMQTLEAMNDKARAATPAFIDNENDKKNMVKDGHLTDAQRLELSLYVADLINQIRDAFGKPRVTVTQDAVDFAKQVADGYEAARDDIYSGHNTQVINRVAAQSGLFHIESGEGNSYENLYGHNGQDIVSNMNEAKYRVHDALVLFMFGGDEWEHARSIAGFDLDTKWVKEDTEYFGVDISTYVDKYGTQSKRVHFIKVRPKQILEGSTFDTTAIENPNSSVVITERYNQAKTALDAATTAANTAKADLTTAQTAYTSAKTAYDKAVADLASAQAVKVQTPEAQRALNTAQANVAQAQATLTAKEARVNELTAGREVLLEKLNDAKAVLASAQAEHAQAVTALNTAKADLASKQAVLDTAVAKRDAIQARIDELEAEIAKAEQTISESKAAQAKLPELKAYIANLQAKLAEAQEAKTQVETDLVTLRETAMKAQEAYQALLDMVALQVDNDVFVMADGTIVAVPKVAPKADPLPAFDLNDLVKEAKGEPSGKQAGPVTVLDGQAPVARPTAPASVSSSAPTATTTVVKGATLPETGEASTSLVSLLGFVTLGLGLATASKRRRQG